MFCASPEVALENQERFALTMGFCSFFCDPWKYFVVSSSLSLWDLNRVSPICGTVVETRFPVVPELTTCLPLWGSADMVSLTAETKSCILLRCSSALPLCFQSRTIQCFCTSSLSVRNPCINKLGLSDMRMQSHVSRPQSSTECNLQLFLLVI